MKLKYGYGTGPTWKEDAEIQCFANTIRWVCSVRDPEGMALKEIAGQYVRVDISGLSNDQITPAKGFYIYGRCVPVIGPLEKVKGRKDKILSFKTDINGQEWAIAQWQWKAAMIVRDGLYTEEVLQALNAEKLNGELYNDVRWFIPQMPIDTDSPATGNIISSYNWTALQENEPIWPEIQGPPEVD